MKKCWIQVKQLMEIAIWQFTAHTTQVYIVTPRTSQSTTCPSLRKACLIIDLVVQKKIIMEVRNPLNIQPSIRDQLKRMFSTPSKYKKGYCKQRSTKNKWLFRLLDKALKEYLGTKKVKLYEMSICLRYTYLPALLFIQNHSYKLQDKY